MERWIITNSSITDFREFRSDEYPSDDHHESIDVASNKDDYFHESLDVPTNTAYTQELHPGIPQEYTYTMESIEGSSNNTKQSKQKCC